MTKAEIKLIRSALRSHARVLDCESFRHFGGKGSKREKLQLKAARVLILAKEFGK